jgi:hypothetical protein
LYFKIDQEKTDAWGITFLYGCTALMITNPKHVIGQHELSLQQKWLLLPDSGQWLTQPVAHMQEINSNACLSLSDTPTVKKFIKDKLEPASDHVSNL